jgi:hypothetical protein
MQGGKLKWVSLGDENIKFFHANATIKHNKSSIMTLEDSEGGLVSKHEEKAQMLWEAYKERLGKSEYTHMYFNLPDLLHNQEGLEELVAPFQQEEIDANGKFSSIISHNILRVFN